MTLTELIDYIGEKWPTITDAQQCAYAIHKEFDISRAADTDVIDVVLGYYDRHQHD